MIDIKKSRFRDASWFEKVDKFKYDFRSANQRMHNKTFTADGCMAIVGGRNFADEDFGLAEKYNFLDLDVLACGPVVKGVSKGFDEFWNSIEDLSIEGLT